MRVTLGLALSGRFCPVLSLHFLLYQGTPVNPIHSISYSLKDLPIVTMLPLVPMELTKNISQPSKIVF